MRTAISIATGAMIVLASISSSAFAATLEQDRMYVGGGMADNDVDDESATGYQFFAGYELPVDTGNVDTAVEIGFWDSGDHDVNTPAGTREKDADGVWANGVASIPIAERLDLVGRAGVDFGDDDGLMIGGGVGVDLADQVEVRGEYVLRDETDSLQANVVYRF